MTVTLPTTGIEPSACVSAMHRSGDKMLARLGWQNTVIEHKMLTMWRAFWSTSVSINRLIS